MSNPQQNAVMTWLIPGLAALAGAAALVFWLTVDPAADLVVHGPAMDGAPPESEVRIDAVTIGEHSRQGPGVPADIPGCWPGFRGANHDNQSTESVALADHWTPDQPRVLWETEMGEGHSGAAIRNGRVYVLDYNEAAGRDALRCLSLEDGREIWRREYDVAVQRNHGMSRTVPAVSEKYVVSIGPRGHVMCVEAETGDLCWGIDLVKDYGTEIPMWHTGQCPLILDEVAVLAPAGKDVLMMGVDCATGNILWKTPNPKALGMSHTSIMPAVFDGVPMFVYAALGGIVGVGRDGDQTGKILWVAPQWDRSVIAPSPVVFEDGRIFVTAGYGAGSMLLKVIRDGETFRVETLDTITPVQGLASEQQTPVMHDGFLFGILPNDAGALRNQLVCVSLDNPRKFVWTSGRENRFGLGPYLLADGKLYVLSDDGVLTMLKASSEGYAQTGQKRLMNGRDAWAPMALAGGRLVLRDDTRMLCVDLR